MPHRSRLVITTSWILTLVVTCAVQLLYMIGSVLNNRVGFDTGYNLTVSQHLGTGQGYVSAGYFYGSIATPFDVYISTGPTVLAPLGLAYAFEWDHLLVARLMMLIPYTLMIAGLAVLGFRLGGRWLAVALTLSPLLYNPFGAWGAAEFQGPTDVLGETLAAALTLFAVIVVTKEVTTKRIVLSGLLLGLAGLTKTIALIAAPVLLGFVAYTLIRGRTRAVHILAREVIFIVSLAAPGIVWQIIILISLGFADYKSNLKQQLSFLLTGGSGLESSSGTQNFTSFFDSWVISPALVLSIAIFALISLGVLAAGKHSQTTETSALKLLLAVILVSTVWFYWWAFISDRPYSRSYLPGAVLISAGTIATVWLSLTYLLRSIEVRNGTKFLLLLALIGASCSSVAVAWTPPGSPLQTQRVIARALDNGSASFAYVDGQPTGDFDLVQIAAVSELAPVPLAEAGPEISRLYLPFAASAAEITPEQRQILSDNCQSVILEVSYVTVCERKLK